MRSIVIMMVLGGILAGCAEKSPEYGREPIKYLSTKRRQAWAIAPVINLSGEQGVDPFLQADIVYSQLQQVKGVTAIPVNRVAEVYASLGIDRINSPEQAALVCDLLQCDGIIVSTVTLFDPYNPPKMGAAMQLFIKPGSYARPENISPRELAQQASPKEMDVVPVNGNVIQVVGMFDAQNGTVRDRLERYTAGRFDPNNSPLGAKEYLVNMDRYCGFVYWELIDQVIVSPKLKGL
jgi:hypothetical protein